MDIVRTYFELEKRKYTPNVVVRVDVTLNEKGKDVLHKKVVACPTETKPLGDKMAILILKAIEDDRSRIQDEVPRG